MEATIITLEELKNNYDELGLINEKQAKRVRYIETETTKIVNSYIFIQAIIFLANNVMISSTDHIRAYCKQNNWWVPFCLSLLIAVPFGITFAAKAHEWKRTVYEFDMNLAGRELMYHKMSSRKKGTRDQLEDGNSDASMVCKPDVVKVYQRNIFIYVTAFALLGYTVVILTACARSRTLCHGVA